MDFRESDYDVMALLEHLQDPDPAHRDAFVDSLPTTTEEELSLSGHQADNCPICHETFLSVIALAEMAYAMDSPANSPYELGVTKLPTCGHYFCKKDLSKWIIVAKKDTCPTCRTPMGVQVVQDSPTAEAENGDQAPFPLPAEMEQQLQREMLRLREAGVLSAPGSMVDLGALLSGHADLRRTEFEYEETDRSEFPMYS